MSSAPLLMAIIVWSTSGRSCVENYRGGYYAGTAGVIEIPIWPFMAVVVIGAAATAVQFLLDAWRLMRARRRPRTA